MKYIRKAPSNSFSENLFLDCKDICKYSVNSVSLRCSIHSVCQTFVTQHRGHRVI